LRSQQEKNEPQSCLNKARPEEYIFVLLARDKAAPHAIRQWCSMRILLGLNDLKDEKIQTALHVAEQMERER
jgi:hypothetical protein